MLKDLHELGVTLQNSYQTTFTPEDKELPSLFKQLVNNIEGSAVSYNRNSFVVTINYSNQKIYFPNQLWYIAAYFADFYKALSEYAQIIKTHLRLSDDNIKKAKDNREIANSLISSASVDDEDKEYLIRFLSDYDWWFGGKGIERADYYVSPILSLCKLVNASQSYVADLCKYLAKNDDALNILKHINEKRGLNKIQIFEDSVLNSFVYKLFKYIEKEDSLNALIPYAKYSNANRIGLDDTLIHLELDDKRTHSIFIQTTDESNISARNSGKIKRWYEHIFHFDQKKVYLTTQWSADTIDILIFIINHAYKGKLQIDKIGDNCILYTLKNQQTELSNIDSSYLPYLTALRTKPFMLLAGISGTGKSRIVRELAFKSCPSYLQDEDGTTPGNYCMIEVKPNWHDSSELLGYYSNIAKQYVFTDFVKFLLKAKLYNDVPFFVCMDEMNLAPVEQYFAEFLSVLETRKQTESGIKTGALVKGHYFKRIKSVNEYDNVQTDADVYTLLEIPITAGQKEELAKTNSLKTEGLTLPENVFVIGTVNMDDTTHQFSRKVLDRAMTMEMNGGELKDMFGHSSDLEYLPEENVWKIDQFKPKHVNADEVLEEHIDSNGNLDETGIALKTQLADKLDAINQVLKDTPFVVSYRVLNELVIYAGVLLDDGRETEEAINNAVDQITLMKILPRIEGDEDMLGNAKDKNNRLCQLMKVVGPKSQAKIKEMNRRLESGFTRFWP